MRIKNGQKYRTVNKEIKTLKKKKKIMHAYIQTHAHFNGVVN